MMTNAIAGPFRTWNIQITVHNKNAKVGYTVSYEYIYLKHLRILVNWNLCGLDSAHLLKYYSFSCKISTEYGGNFFC